MSFADVAGVEDAKAELEEVVDFLRDPERFARLGARVPKGLLLYGPPGTGKTLLAKAVAHESGASFYSQSASAFVEMFAGLGASRIRKLFETARKHAPAIIFIDELDAVGAARSGHGFNREQDQTLNQLLVELDGFATAEQVVVMGASNRIQDLDPALLRPGRFDRQLLVAPPDLAGREKILEVHTRGKPLADDVDLQSLARQTAGLAGADLANICNEAAIFAGRRNLDRIGQAEFEAALERVVAGLQQRRVVSEKEKRILAYHESGHALMSYLMGEALPVHKVTIVSRGQALGYTLNLPMEERFLRTKEEMVDMMKVFLAGRAAEQVVFGRVTNGAANDLEKATDLARAMVFEYGMGDAVAEPDDAGRQLFALGGDEASARRRAGSSDRRGVPRGDPPDREAPGPSRPPGGGAARAGDAEQGPARRDARRHRARVPRRRDRRHRSRGALKEVGAGLKPGTDAER